MLVASRKIRSIAVAATAAGTLCFAGMASAQMKVDPNLPTYKPTGGVSGSIQSVGSDTMNNLMTLWGEGFRNFYPNVEIEIEGKGSSTAPPALIEGTANFGPMSRAMKDAEIDGFEKEFGYKPVQLETAIDMLAVYVHKDNPIGRKGLSLAEVDAIFSKSRNLGYEDDVTRWGQLGLTGRWNNLPISIYGRNAASGTYGYFKKHALGKGDYKDSVKEQPGSSAVVQGVATDLGGIGYSGIGYKTADVIAIPLAANRGETPVPAEPQYGYTGEYPLARYLYLSVNKKPGENLDPLRHEFVKFVFSKQGQEVVIKDGYMPVTAELAKKACEKAGVDW